MSTLILLVGANGLPNYVTARYLYENYQDEPEDDKEYLPEIFDRILLVVSNRFNKNEFDALNNAIVHLEEFTGKRKRTASIKRVNIGDASDFSNIKNITKRELQYERGIVHLHYTGAKRTIGIQVRAAIEELKFEKLKKNQKQFEEIHYSYLDSETHRLFYDNDTRPSSNNLLAEIELKDLSELGVIQNWEFFDFKSTPVQTELVVEIFESTLRKPSFRAEPMAESIEETEERRLVANEINNLRNLGWLKYHIYNQVLQLPSELRVRAYIDGELRRKNETDNYLPEFSFLTLRGYELTYFICPVTNDRGEFRNPHSEIFNRAYLEIKAHTYEALHRARQIGGSEARVVLVTLAQEVSRIERELKEDFRGDDFNFFVLGYNQLFNLSGELQKIFPEFE